MSNGDVFLVGSIHQGADRFKYVSGTKVCFYESVNFAVRKVVVPGGQEVQWMR